MINSYYGSSIYEDAKKTLAEKGLGDNVYICEPNQPDVAAKLQNGNCPIPCVLPYIESKYIVSPSYDTFTTTGADGGSRIHTFDFQNSMPVMLKVYFTPIAHTIMKSLDNRGVFDNQQLRSSSKHLQSYLTECCYKFNRRNSTTAEILNELLYSAVRTDPLTYINTASNKKIHYSNEP